MLLEREILCSQWEGSECAHEWSSFFLFTGVGGGESDFFVFFPLVKRVTQPMTKKIWKVRPKPNGHF